MNTFQSYELCTLSFCSPYPRWLGMVVYMNAILKLKVEHLFITLMGEIVMRRNFREFRKLFENLRNFISQIHKNKSSHIRDNNFSENVS